MSNKVTKQWNKNNGSLTGILRCKIIDWLFIIRLKVKVVSGINQWVDVFITVEDGEGVVPQRKRARVQRNPHLGLYFVNSEVSASNLGMPFEPGISPPIGIGSTFPPLLDSLASISVVVERTFSSGWPCDLRRLRRLSVSRKLYPFSSFPFWDTENAPQPRLVKDKKH